MFFMAGGVGIKSRLSDSIARISSVTQLWYRASLCTYLLNLYFPIICLVYFLPLLPSWLARLLAQTLSLGSKMDLNHALRCLVLCHVGFAQTWCYNVSYKSSAGVWIYFFMTWIQKARHEDWPVLHQIVRVLTRPGVQFPSLVQCGQSCLFSICRNCHSCHWSSVKI